MRNPNPYHNSFGIDYQDGDLSLERIPYRHTPKGNDVTHVVLPGETIFSISHQYYGNSGLWYMIADFNKIYNPLEEIVEGLILIIPDGRG
jgi:nucleoid-associated protein YgaU